MRKTILSWNAAALTSAVLVSVCGTGMVAQASPDTDGAADEIIVELVADAIEADDMDSTVDSHVLTGEDVIIEVPTNPVEPIVLDVTNDGDDPLEIVLPFANEASDVEVGDAGQLEFDNNNETTTSVLPYEDGAVQFISTILDESAPHEFIYELSLPDGFMSIEQDDGSLLFVDENGELLTGVAAPWAKDDSGTELHTWYEVRGSSLVQMVDHHDNVHYPVVADPFFGKKLFSSIWRDRYNGDWRYNGNVSTWGVALLAGTADPRYYGMGVGIMNNQGWSEWTAKYPAIKNKATLRQQYYCHASTGIYGLPIAKTYNLERSRANNAAWWWNIQRHKCNW